MRRYLTKEVTVHREVEVEAKCDGCGVAEADTELGLIPVAIEIDYGNCFGRRDELDFCNDCLIEKSPLFVAAGSKCSLVTGKDPIEGTDEDE